MNKLSANAVHAVKKIKKEDCPREPAKKGMGALLWWELKEEGLIDPESDPVKLTDKGEKIFQILNTG